MTDIPGNSTSGADNSSTGQDDDVASAYTADVDVPPDAPSAPGAPITPDGPSSPDAPATPGVPSTEPGDPNPPLPDPGPRDGTHSHDGITPDQPDVGDAFAEGFEHPEQH